MGSINQEILDKITFLSDLPFTKAPFISLYFGIDGRELLEHKNRIFIKNSLRDAERKIVKNSDYLEDFLSDSNRINDFIENNIREEAHGVCIFACKALGVFESYQSMMPFNNSFSIDRYPHLRQLAHHALEYKNILAALIDSKYARVFNIKMGSFIIKELDIQDPVHRFHKEGGWSDFRYQHHIDNQVLKHFDRIAAIVTEFMDKEKYEELILIGQHHEIKNFADRLPERIMAKVIATDELYMRSNLNDIKDKVISEIKNEDRINHDRLVKSIIESSYGEYGVLGIQDTIFHAAEGRIRTLAIAEGFDYMGYRCNGCYYTDEKSLLDFCPECTEEMIETNLVEEAVKMALKEGARVQPVEGDAAEELKKHGGIGAYLRY